MLMSSRHCCLCGSSEASEWYIEDVESKADGITKLLQFEADIRIVGVAQFAALANHRVRITCPNTWKFWRPGCSNYMSNLKDARFL